MTNTELYTNAVAQARTATEKAVDTFKKGAQTLTDQADLVTKLPTIDLTTPVQRYFDFVQQTVDTNRELATKWAELVTSLTSTFREQAQSFGNVVKEQTSRVGDLVTEQAERAEQAAQEQAAAVEKAEKDQIKQAQKAEREAAKKDHDEARAAYEGLTKAELSEQLAERDLPKSGNVDELIERLVSADSN